MDVVSDPGSRQRSARAAGPKRRARADQPRGARLSFDRAYNALSFAAVSCGVGTGGRIEPYRSLLGADLLHPTDPAATYDWVDFDKTQPTGPPRSPTWRRPGSMARARLCRVVFSGPLGAGCPAAGSLVLASSDRPRSMFGLRAAHGRSLDLPILALQQRAGRQGQRRSARLRRAPSARRCGADWTGPTAGGPAAHARRSLPRAGLSSAHAHRSHPRRRFADQSGAGVVSRAARILLRNTTAAGAPVITPLPSGS